MFSFYDVIMEIVLKYDVFQSKVCVTYGGPRNGDQGPEITTAGRTKYVSKLYLSTHWDPDKMAAIFQITSLSAFSWM